MSTIDKTVSTPDEIAARILERNAKHIEVWGEPCMTWGLSSVAKFPYDRRCISRVWGLIDALRADVRFKVDVPRSVYDAEITLL